MKRSAMVLGCCLLLLCCCARRGEEDPVVVEEDQSDYRPVLNVADLKVAAQLLRGWHQVEGSGWRWTERTFAVLMNVPVQQQPALLELKFLLPEVSIGRLHSITLRARVGAFSLRPQEYTQAGSYTYTQWAPAEAMAGPTVRIEFELDKALARGEVDGRELGIVVT